VTVGRLADGELLETVIALDARAPAAARNVVVQCLEQRVVASALENAQLLVSELVTQQLATQRRTVAAAADQSTMGVYTHFGSKQGLLEQLYLHGFERLEDRLGDVPCGGDGRQELLASALAYRGFAVGNEALYGLMFERATPDFVPSDASRLAGLTTFEMLAARIADWSPDSTDPATDAHLVWAAMHGLVTIELMHRRWGGSGTPTNRAGSMASTDILSAASRHSQRCPRNRGNSKPSCRVWFVGLLRRSGVGWARVG
jgi:AcrR family transcriptional regulator